MLILATKRDAAIPRKRSISCDSLSSISKRPPPQSTIIHFPNMNHVVVIKYKDLVKVAWKNGQGFTREIAIHPTESLFEWRLSMAELVVDGPFSEFKGINRTLLLLEGEDIVLTIDGIKHSLSVFQPISFPGDVPTSMTMGASKKGLDLNLMWDSTKFCTSVSMMRYEDDTTFEFEYMAFVLATEISIVEYDGQLYELSKYDILHISECNSNRIKIIQGTACISTLTKTES